jgi:hypothetical protein
MAKTYEPIQSQTLGSANASVTFSSIPQTYTDLILVSFFGTTTLNEDAFVRFNGDTGSNYSRTSLRGNGSSAFSARSSNQTSCLIDLDAAGSTLDTGLQIITQIFNYSNSSVYKSLLSRSGTLGGSYTGTTALGGLWRSTAAITTLLVNCTNNTFISGSSFTLYGVKSA